MPTLPNGIGQGEVRPSKQALMAREGRGAQPGRAETREAPPARKQAPQVKKQQPARIGAVGAKARAKRPGRDPKSAAGVNAASPRSGDATWVADVRRRSKRR